MAFADSTRLPVPAYFNPTSQSTSTPLYSSLNTDSGYHLNNDSGYHSVERELGTPFLRICNRTLLSDSPLPPSALTTTYSSDPLAKVLFEDEALARRLDSQKDYFIPVDDSHLNDTEFEDSSHLSCQSASSVLSPQLFQPYKNAQSVCWKPYLSVWCPGQEMGENQLDFLRELGHNRNLPELVHRICSFLDKQDLVRVGQVSHTWRTLIQRDSQLDLKRSNYLENVKSFGSSFGKENHHMSGKSRPRVSRPISNLFRNIGNQLDLDNPPPLSNVKKDEPPAASRLPLYQEQAKKLLPCEHLQPCPRCQFPSRVTPGDKRAHCTSSRCLFDYCTQCRDTFHAPTPCKKSRIVGSSQIPSPKKTLIGHKASRRFLRRL